MSFEEEQSAQGTCFQMCPVEEIELRERQRRIHFFEIVKDVRQTDTTAAANSERKARLPFIANSATSLKCPQVGYAKADPEAMVKEFSRSAAGRSVLPSSLRPAAVLRTTMSYLIDEISDRTDRPWHFVYAFMCDRIRAIRQDMVIQRIGAKDSIEILEKAVRFHVLAGYKLAGESLAEFDPKLNRDHTQECLKRLLSLYDSLDEVSPQNRAEFEAYYLLYNANSFDALSRGISLPSKLRNVSRVRLALEIIKAVLLRNFVRFFRLANRQLSYLESCSLYGHYSDVRSEALAALNTAYSSRNCLFPLNCLTDILSFNDEQQARNFCSHFGIEISANAVKFSKESFTITDETFRPEPCQKIDAKFLGKCSTVLHHGLQVFAPVPSVYPDKKVATEGKLKARQLQLRNKCVQQNANRTKQDEDGPTDKPTHAQMQGVFSEDGKFHVPRGRGRGRGRAAINSAGGGV